MLSMPPKEPEASPLLLRAPDAGWSWMKDSFSLPVSHPILTEREGVRLGQGRLLREIAVTRLEYSVLRRGSDADLAEACAGLVGRIAQIVLIAQILFDAVVNFVERHLV